MPDILILADDLSGAADCGITFASVGLDTVVLLDQRGALPDADALALDLDTRRLPAGPAAALAVDAVRLLHTPGSPLYKKIDSTLRGNWAAETAAIHTALVAGGEAPLAVVAPAFPATGRTTRQGRLLVEGTPLEETEIWRREGIPGVADLPALLRAAGLTVALADLALIRRGGEALRAALAGWLEEGVNALACDAESEEDLAALARATAAVRRRVFWVGSAGLARHLASALGLARESALPVPAMPTPPDPVLTIVGSLSCVARAQAKELAAQPGVRRLSIAPPVLRLGPGTAEWGHAEQDLREALGSGDDLLLTMETGDSPDIGADLTEGHALAVALGRLVHEQAPRIGGLVVAGGETARAVLAALGINAIRLLGEVEPGVPLGLAEGARTLPVITKAGAFGSPDTLVRCRERLRAAAPHMP
ncbi:four-carbon acid sugar kinase family protein [Azospirillum sp.]|uniref:four-carbon acid sugar kinase family protein n=1 Tax=Azospirillum sp. TaxID=34012 RepID=UPI003D73B753